MPGAYARHFAPNSRSIPVRDIAIATWAQQQQAQIEKALSAEFVDWAHLNSLLAQRPPAFESLPVSTQNLRVGNVTVATPTYAEATQLQLTNEMLDQLSTLYGEPFSRAFAAAIQDAIAAYRLPQADAVCVNHLALEAAILNDRVVATADEVYDRQLAAGRNNSTTSQPTTATGVSAPTAVPRPPPATSVALAAGEPALGIASSSQAATPAIIPASVGTIAPHANKRARVENNPPLEQIQLPADQHLSHLEQCCSVVFERRTPPRTPLGAILGSRPTIDCNLQPITDQPKLRAMVSTLVAKSHTDHVSGLLLLLDKYPELRELTTAQLVALTQSSFNQLTAEAALQMCFPEGLCLSCNAAWHPTNILPHYRCASQIMLSAHPSYRLTRTSFYLVNQAHTSVRPRWFLRSLFQVLPRNHGVHRFIDPHGFFCIPADPSPHIVDGRFLPTDPRNTPPQIT